MKARTILSIVFISLSHFLFAQDSLGKEYTDVSKWKVTSDKNLDFNIKYPANLLKMSKFDVGISLWHEIPWNEKSPCDLSEDSTKMKMLTDFYISFALYKNMKEAVGGTTFGMNLLEEVKPDSTFKTDNEGGYFQHYDVKEKLKGYVIYFGNEGCGTRLYYFRLASGQVLELSKIEDYSDIDKYIDEVKVKRSIVAIRSNQAEQLINKILSTFTMQKK